MPLGSAVAQPFSPSLRATPPGAQHARRSTRLRYIKEEVLLVDRVVGAGIGLVGAEPRPGLPLADLPLVVGLRDPHRPQPVGVELAARVHEPRPARHPAAQSAILPPEQEQRVPTSVSQRHQQPAVLGELRCPVRGHVRATYRGHDAIEWRPLSNAIEAVAAQHRDPGIPGTGQQPPSLGDHVLGDIHGDHQALIADQLGQEGGVVAGARADLKDLEPWVRSSSSSMSATSDGWEVELAGSRAPNCSTSRVPNAVSE
jgi:hypothetical protein